MAVPAAVIAAILGGGIQGAFAGSAKKREEEKVFAQKKELTKFTAEQEAAKQIEIDAARKQLDQLAKKEEESRKLVETLVLSLMPDIDSRIAQAKAAGLNPDDVLGVIPEGIRNNKTIGPALADYTNLKFGLITDQDVKDRELARAVAQLGLLKTGAEAQAATAAAGVQQRALAGEKLTPTQLGFASPPGTQAAASLEQARGSTEVQRLLLRLEQKEMEKAGGPIDFKDEAQTLDALLGVSEQYLQSQNTEQAQKTPKPTKRATTRMLNERLTRNLNTLRMGGGSPEDAGAALLSGWLTTDADGQIWALGDAFKHVVETGDTSTFPDLAQGEDAFRYLTAGGEQPVEHLLAGLTTPGEGPGAVPLPSPAAGAAAGLSAVAQAAFGTIVPGGEIAASAFRAFDRYAEAQRAGDEARKRAVRVDLINRLVPGAIGAAQPEGTVTVKPTPRKKK